VANPSGILLAASLMLGEGLGERAAARTLERAVSHALASGARTADLEGSGPAATTRDFTDVVLDLMPSARTDVEFHPEPV
jgi:3-isopropylmalate dehydrogenase